MCFYVVQRTLTKTLSVLNLLSVYPRELTYVNLLLLDIFLHIDKHLRPSRSSY